MQRRPPTRPLIALLLAGLAASAWPDPPPAALVAILIDTSGSVAAPELDRARRLALDVLRSLPAGSEVAVFTFDDESRLVLPRTSKAADVERALLAVRISGRHTALHDALYDASRYLRESGVARGAILLITDGKDEQSALNLDDGLRLAQEGRIPVFAVGVGQVEERGLRRIAKLTGGQFQAARDARGAALVSTIMASPAGEARAAGSAVAPPASGPAVQAPAPSRAAQPSPEKGSAGSRLPRMLRIPAALVAVAAIAFVLLAARRPRAPSRSQAERDAAVVEMSPTVVARMASTEEYLEKTVVLRERPVLAVARGPLAGQVFELSGTSSTSLGRAKANDLVLDDPSVSSQHCRIRPDEDGFTVLDLKSTNGTFVNERRVSAHKLAEGDVIKLGEMQLQFRMEHRRG